ncbi:Sec1-like protein [Lipomyces arxii]|uniref:Sec1-like protein n=1 Tax=Lipomyces arxii TaxID=56418 RepID=UPI0034CF7160
MVFSVKELYRKRVLDLLDSIKVKNKYKYLVLDEYTSQLVHNVLTVDEILRHNVSAIERIEERRQIRGSFEAMYILSPQRHIVNCLLADFVKTPTRYSAAHVFFVPKINQHFIDEIYNSPAASYIQTCEALMIDFFPQQSNIFTFNDSDSLPLFYNPSCMNLVKQEILKVANKLVSVCVCLGEYPIVRYYSPPQATHNAYTLPYLIANTFQQELDAYARANKNFPSVEADRPQSVFLVLDRTVDLSGPFLHELTVEAMAHDLCPIKNNKYTYQEIDNNGASAEADGDLTEDDDLWTELRHLFISNATETLNDRVARFQEEHPEVRDQNLSLTALKQKLLTSHAVTQEMARMNLIQSLMSTLTSSAQSSRLLDVIKIEQCLATAMTDDGELPKTVLRDMVPLLDDQVVLAQDRARMIGLYLLYRNGIIDADLKKLCLHAKLNGTYMILLQNLDLLGAHVIKQSLKERSYPKKPTPLDSIESSAERIRYILPLKNILEGVVHNTLDLQLYKAAKDQPSAASDLAQDYLLTPSTTSSRRNRAVWHDRALVAQTPAQRIFVFIAGGMTYAEARTAYEISGAYDKEVIIGSQDFISPSDWLQQLSRLRMNRADLKLKADQPEPEMPPYLLEREKPVQSRPPVSNAQVPATAPHKLSRMDHNHHKTGGNPPGHFNVEKKKPSKLERLFK